MFRYILFFFSFLIGCVFAHSQVPQVSDMIAYYPFSGNADDLSGNNYDGTLNGGPTLTQNRFGHSNAAYSLDGVDDYIYFGNTMYADLPDTDGDGYYEDSFSISIWAKSSVNAEEAFVAFGESDGLYTGMIARIGDNISFNSSNWGIATSTSGRKYDGQWHQYVFVYVAGNSRKIFIDGSLVIQSTDSQRRFNFKNYGVSVGVERFNTSGIPEGMTNTYTGNVDDVRVWNVALTNTDVASLYTYENDPLNAITPFVTTWQTDGSDNITIPLTGSGYDFTIDWGDGTTETKVGTPGNISHIYSTAGVKTVSVTPNITTGFPRIYVNNFGNRLLLQTIESWGSGSWGVSMEKAFDGANNLDVNATDVPDFSVTTNFQYMFQNCSSFNGNISNWVFTTDATKNISAANMFYSASSFNQDISNWNVERFTNMSNMFTSAIAFNSPLNWGIKTANVTNMSGMFNNSKVFAQDISSWNVGNVANMSFMFKNADAFNQNISVWDVSSVTNMSQMFSDNNLFNKNLSSWDVSSVTNMNFMFWKASNFNSPLNWGNNTGNVTNMSGMFKEAVVFNQDISNWDVSSVINLGYMFRSTNAFNKDLSNWDVSSVTNMSEMFYQASGFNRPLNWGIKTANVLNMSTMFYQANSFNQDLNSWDVSSVISFGQMFHGAQAFNGNISNWQFTTDMTKNISMASMFRDASSFNQNINGWNVKRVNQMQRMFQNTPFNQDISSWDISRVANHQLFLSGGKLSRANYDSLLLGWSTLDSGETQVPSNLNAYFGTSKYSNTPAVLNARNTLLISQKGWTITDGGMDSDVVLPFIVSNSLASDNSTISVTFSKNVYRTDVGGGVLETTDFLFSISGGTATLNATTPISILTSDNLTFDLGIDINVVPNGTETLIVTPVLNSVFDVSGNGASISQSNNTAQLNDLSAPIITGPSSETGLNSSVSLNENIAAVFTFSTNKSVNWTLGSANDENLFSIDASGVVVFSVAPDYEVPTDGNLDNIYVVDVIATDSSGRNTIQTLTITITDVLPATVSTFSNETKFYFDASYTIKAPTSNSTGAFTYTSSNSAVATIIGTTVTVHNAGNAVITATQVADATYDSANVTSTLTVSSVSVVTKNGALSNTDLNYVNRNGLVGDALGLNQYGASLQTKAYDLVPGSVLHLDAGNINSYPGSGTTWTDLSGNGNNGTLQNGVGYNSANEGALVFDGANDYFVTDTNLDLSDTDKLTIQIIIKYSSAAVALILEHSTSWNSNNAFGVSAGEPSGKMQFTDHNQGYNAPRSTNTLNDNNWHFFSVTVDRSQVASNQSLIYVDGALNHTQTSLNADTSGNYSNFPLYIGSRAGSSYFFNGNIAQVLIYKRVLTAAEIEQNFNAAKSRYGL